METKAKILVVDDEEKICRNMQKILAKEDYDVSYALSADEALEKMAKESYSLLISDIVMPGIPTQRILEKVKEISPKTQVVMITGKLLDSGLQEELKLKGASFFLQKPFKLDDVMKLLPG